MRPSFIVIGAMKCGTTSLHGYLSAHPEIGVSRGKETDFFLAETNVRRGLGWYQRQFVPGFQIYGEVSPNYTKFPEFPGVPERIAGCLPDVKLIYLVRDPVERFLSQYRHHYLLGEHRLAPDELLDSQPGRCLLDCSRYYKQLTRYLMFFPRSQIHIISSTDLTAKRDSVLRDLFTFLEVAQVPIELNEDRRLNRSEDLPKLPPWAARARRSTLARKLRRRTPTSVQSWVVRRLARRSTGQAPATPAGIRSKIADRLFEDAAAFRGLTGKDFKDWSI